MALEQNNEQHYREVPDKYIDPAATVIMTTRDYVVRPSADAISGAIIIHLPPVAEAKGRFYSIVARNADGTNTITVSDLNDSECWIADVVLDGKCDKLLFYSDGLCWHTLGSAGPGRIPGYLTTASPGTTQPPTTAAPTSLAPTTILTTAAPVQTTLAPTTLAPTTLLTTTA